MTPLMMVFVVVAMTAVTVSAQPHRAPYDDYGVIDTIRFQMIKIDDSLWRVDIMLANDESVAAMTLPLAWGPDAKAFRLDSADYNGLRTSYFALKTYYPDTLKGTILIGLISDLGTGLPPLEPGSGPIARLHFTAQGDSGTDLLLDTTFIRPHNVLQLVTPDAGSILPALDTRKVLRHSAASGVPPIPDGN